MKIGVIGSMQFTEKMLAVRDELISLGHEAFITDLHRPFIGKNDEEKETIKLHQKNNLDAIREFWNKMQGADAVLVLNLDKNGIKNYIGGNTLMEIGFAHVLHQKIFLYNHIPDIPFYKTEIEAVKPVIINGDLTKIKNEVVHSGKYQHYKGKFYEVLGEGRNSETLEDVVIYRGLYDSAEFGKNPCWVRPKKMFFENVVIEGKEVPRFRRVEREKNIASGDFDQHLTFLREVEQLKHVERAIMTSSLQRYENSAEHSWHAAMFLLVLRQEFPDADVMKMLKMILVHDLVEIYAGDTPAFDAAARKTQQGREQAAAKKLFSLLPPHLSEEFFCLFEEFERQETAEANIVKSCDKLQAMLQNILSQGKTLQKNKLDAAWVENYHKEHRHPVCIHLYEQLFQEMKDKKLLWDGS